MKYKIVIIAILITHIVWSQGQTDNWLLGYHEEGYEDERYSIVLNMRTGEIDSIPNNINFESTMASISDEEGNLLMYTNGCAIYNANHEMMLNGEGLNPGDVHDLACPDYGYLLPDGAMFVPDPAMINNYYLLHLKGIDHPKYRIHSNQLLYSKIKIDPKISSGEVKEKNISLGAFEAESFAITKHGNGRDWWIIVPQRMSNQYHIYLVDPSGIHFFQSQQIGFDFSQDKCNFTGNSIFSSDGSTLARITSHCGMMILKFDRCAGLLDNPIHLAQVYTDYKHINCAFSEDSKSIYILHQGKSDISRYSQRMLIRLDIKKLGISQDPFYRQNLPLGVAPERLVLSQNDELIISEINSKPYLHKIIESSSIQDTIIFKPKQIMLPILNGRSLNYFPNYTLGKIENSICDTISSSFHQNVENYLKIVPNPSLDVFNIHFSLNDKYINIEIVNMFGKIVRSFNYKNPTSPLNLDLSTIISGYYFVKFTTSNYQHSLPIQKL